LTESIRMRCPVTSQIYDELYRSSATLCFTRNIFMLRIERGDCGTLFLCSLIENEVMLLQTRTIHQELEM